MKTLLALLKPSSFKIGVLTVLLLSCLPLIKSRELQLFIHSIDCRIHDLMFRVRLHHPEPTTGQVVIVDIDERSLAELGQWPWPRTVMADIVAAIGKQSPKVIGFDIVFAEPDRTSLKFMLPKLRALTGTKIVLPKGLDDNDEILASVLAETDTILGYYFELPSDGSATVPRRTGEVANPPCPEFSIPAQTIEDLLAQSELPVAGRAVLNIPVLGDSALSEGFFNTVPDPDGVTRRGNLFIQYGQMVYPSLAMEMVREGLGEDPILSGMPSVGITHVSIGSIKFPVTKQGQLVINFRGPKHTFPYVSAVDVLRGRIGKDAFRDKYVLIGTSAIGLLDLRATPVEQTFPGVEVNATIIDNILAADPMTYDEALDLGVTLTILLVFGIFLAAVLGFLGPRVGALMGILVLLFLVYGNYRFLFLDRKLIGLTYPYVGLILVFLVVSVANYFFEGRQKRFIQGAFSFYVSESVVKTLINHPDMLRLEGEEKELSVLFSDIRGFTSISETMTPQQLSSFLNEYLSAMTDIVIEQAGTVDKFIGDAIMAFWGAPLDEPEHAARAIVTALTMRRRLLELQPAWAARNLPPIEIGIGINTGTMRVGNMGSSTRFDYTVMGDNVNLASRLEGLTKVYGAGILISDATRQSCGDRFFYRPIDRVRVKGKSEPVALFEPLFEGAPDAKLAAEVERLRQAIELHNARRFDEAKEAFTALENDHHQKLYGVYLERIEEYLVHPPPEDWDGAYTFTTK